MSDEIQWSQDMMLEVTLKEPDDFLKVRAVSYTHLTLPTILRV